MKTSKNTNRKEEFLKKDLPRFFLLIALILIVILFTALQPMFIKIHNVMDILRTASVVGCLAFGAMLLLQTGDMNFAIGFTCAICASIYGKVMEHDFGMMLPIAILVAIAAGVLINLFIAWLVIKVNIPTFICTLAMSTVLNGLLRFVNKDVTLYSRDWTKSFTLLGQGYIFGVIPIPVVIFAVLAVIIFIFMEKTRLGRHMYAAGANATCARQVGINVKKMKLLGFIFCGIFCAVAGVLQASISNRVTLTIGSDLQMPCMTAALLGATFLTPGKFNVPGAAVAAILMTVIENGVLTAGGTFYTKYIVQGILLCISIGIIAIIREGGLPKVSFTS